MSINRALDPSKWLPGSKIIANIAVVTKTLYISSNLLNKLYWPISDTLLLKIIK